MFGRINSALDLEWSSAPIWVKISDSISLSFLHISILHFKDRFFMFGRIKFSRTCVPLLLKDGQDQC